MKPLRQRVASHVALCGALAYVLWPTGRDVTDGRHDRGRNALWLQHGWRGDDTWFTRNRRDPSRFRSTEAAARLAARLRAHGITDVFPHLCPVGDDGGPAPVDPTQVERFLDGTQGPPLHALDRRCLRSPRLPGRRGASVDASSRGRGRSSMRTRGSRACTSTSSPGRPATRGCSRCSASDQLAVMVCHRLAALR